MVTTGTDTLAAHVRGYAQAVRLHLSDLGPDVVEDLTDGLEADLTDALLDLPDQGRVPVPVSDPRGPREVPQRSEDTSWGEGGGGPVTTVLDLAAVFGPAAAYAVELRSAAGLAPAAVGEYRPPRRWAVGRGIVAAYEAVAERWRAVWRPFASSPAGSAILDFLKTLAPAWWILRGWVVVTVLLFPFGMSVRLWPYDRAAQFLMIVAIVVSVQWGRGKWLPRRSWAPRLLMVASVGAAVAAVPLVLYVASAGQPYDYAGGSGYDAGFNDGYNQAQFATSPVDYLGEPGSDGVWVDGMQVSNLFAFDQDGNPLRNVQLFDDRGRPVRTISDQGASQTWAVPDLPGDWVFQPAFAGDGRERWNVYPLQAVELEDTETVFDEDGDGWNDRPVPLTGVRPQSMPWPFLKAPTEIPSKGSPAAPADEEGATEEEPGDGTEVSPEPSAPATGDQPGVAPGGDRPASGTVPGGSTGVPTPTLEATDAD
ncbi:hypothetical protein [Antribacter gilvus]|uniref:hypothetical protein n=1 Tax=Antribacter gilvus TaxID=2304675 RepID=UPI000F78FDFF|nr:hypothetical protein [Antribacter gilvus]